MFLIAKTIRSDIITIVDADRCERGLARHLQNVTLSTYPHVQ